MVPTSVQIFLTYLIFVLCDQYFLSNYNKDYSHKGGLQQQL